MKKITLAIFLFLIASLSCFSQKILKLEPNFDFSSNDVLKNVDLTNPEIGQWKVFSKNLTLSTSANTLTLDLLSGETVSFYKTKTFEDGTTVYWEGNGTNAILKIQENGGELSGYIIINAVYYGISYVGNNNYVVFEKGESDADCDTHLYSFSETNENLSNTASKVALNSCNGIYTYRVVLAYTPELASDYSNNQERINNYLEDVIDSVNEVYINSDLDVRARLAFSYQTDSEYGSKDSDFDAFIHKGLYWTKYDDIFDYVDEYNADVAILLISENIGGRADRDKNMGIYGRLGAATNFGVAHEIGHMFDLDHNREEFNWWQREVNGFDWALDNKKAYGFRGDDFRTVMSYENNDQRRVHFHADSDLKFPDNQSAGDGYAKARDFLQSHKSNVIKHNDLNSISINNKSITDNQMASYYAYNFFETTNLTVSNEARVNLRSGLSINLKAGTHFSSGSQINVQITDCLSSVGFKSDEIISDTKSDISTKNKLHESNTKTNEITIYPNPTSELFTISATEIITNYTVLNSLGNKIVGKEVNSNQIAVNIKNLPSGIYILRITLASGKIITKKIVKN